MRDSATDNFLTQNRMSRLNPSSNLYQNTQSNIKVLNNNQIDRECIVEEYQALRSRHQQWLSKINLSDQQKRQLFGLSESYYCTNKAQKTKLVTVNDFFRGKLIMKESDWKNMEQNKNTAQREDLERFNSENQFAKLDISIDKTESPKRKVKPFQANEKLITQGQLFDEKNLSAILDKVNKLDDLEDFSGNFKNIQVGKQPSQIDQAQSSQSDKPFRSGLSRKQQK